MAPHGSDFAHSGAERVSFRNHETPHSSVSAHSGRERVPFGNHAARYGSRFAHGGQTGGAGRPTRFSRCTAKTVARFACQGVFPLFGAHPTREAQRRLSTTLFPSMGIIRVMCPSWRDTVRRLGTLLIHRRNRFFLGEAVSAGVRTEGVTARPRPSVGQDKKPYK